MKSPDEIKVVISQRGAGKMYHFEQLAIKQHEKIKELESRLAQVERERDALMMDLQTAIYRGRSFNLDCEFCKDKEKPICEDCHWQWRGVCPENTKEE